MGEMRPGRTLGPGHDDFWNWCGKDELRVQSCEACAKLLWPVMDACDACGGTTFTWKRLSGRGRLVSWATFVQDYYKGIVPMPYDTILVELEEGLMFISNPSGFGVRECVTGLAVELTFLDCKDDAGTYRLPVFRKSDGVPGQ
ncbi:MAG TPA: hypothetical protein VF503_33685 [Sphingobium sp.]